MKGRRSIKFWLWRKKSSIGEFKTGHCVCIKTPNGVLRRQRELPREEEDGYDSDDDNEEEVEQVEQDEEEDDDDDEKNKWSTVGILRGNDDFSV